ncbi:hypothetical protein [Coprobacter fastidiosus]|jgi:hypothetical protein
MIKVKINKILSIAFLFLIIVFSACREEELFDSSVVSTGNITTLSFFGDPMDMLKVTTRASDIKDENEKKINQLYIFFFGSDGEYLKGGYLSGYRDAPDEGGYYAPGQGVTLLKIDNQAFANKDLASKATVYAVANVDPVIFGRDRDGDGRPDGITKLSDLKNLVYAPESVSLGLPSGGMPMVGSKVIDLTKTETSSDDERRIDLTALMARIDVDIQLDSEIEENNLPALTLVEWTAKNISTKVPFSTPAVNTETGVDWEDGWTKSITTSMQRTIFNKNGQIAFTFYMYENVQNAEWKVDEGEKWANPSLAGEKGLYPDSIKDYQKQRYKPYLANKNAAAVELHGFYTTYNGAIYEVRYTLYLGANHTDNFQVKRNHQYKNNITIKGLTSQNIETGEYTLDARVNIEEDDNEFYIAMLRERNHDAHFCVTPMDVYMFADKATKNPTMEVILGEVPDGSETPVTVPDWIRMEKIKASDMEKGTVTESGFTAYDEGANTGTHLAVGTAWTAGNGKRAFFTKGLVTRTLSETGKRVTVDNSRDRIYFYIDENLSTTENRRATVTLIYKENGKEIKRRTVVLEQVHLLSVNMRDGGTLYMEQYEEYLDHYDPLDEYSTDQVYTGLPWADKNSNLDNYTIPRLYKERYNLLSGYEEPGQVFNDGHPYTPFVVYLLAQGRMTLQDIPKSAFQYCYNRNKRNVDGSISTDYGTWGIFTTNYYERENKSKWFLPGIRQMEDALTQYYTVFGEFQDNYYWSASAGERENGSSGQSSVRARATKVLPDGSYANSGGGDGEGADHYAYELGNGGYALRTTSLRIRAFRVDTEPMDD